ncbi:MAG TPA: 2OG-Fe(II) oxygenase [Caulobacteraceae bacterium]|jgi:predicted 2-oxoglutarate/Fe(II)-dependent dioxygenase YbiX
MSADNLAELQRNAQAGDVAAMVELGDRLLIGRDAPFEPQEGVALVTGAAERGEPTALVRMATLAGAGAWTTQSWSRAFDLLVEAAHLGSALAQGQLLLLAGDQALAQRVRSGGGEPDAWRRLADSFSIDYWATPTGRRPMCEKPRIRVSDNFITPEICAWLVMRAHGKLKPALMFNGKEEVRMTTRTCSDVIFDIVQSDLISLLVRVRIQAQTKLPTIQMEPFQIFHYALGEEIKAHYDHVRDSALSLDVKSEAQHERIATFLIYLNHDYDGGELEFPHVNFTFKGKTGDAIFFANVDEDGKAERLSLHAAKPITRGEKWMFSQWIQDRPTYMA